MSAVTVQSCVPAVIDAGETVRLLISDSDHPATAWTLAFVLNNGVDAPTSVAGVANGNGFDVVLTATITALLKPVTYVWGLIFTALSPTSEKETGETGIIDVLPNLAATATPSFAQAQVTLLETALAALQGGNFQSVSFNGQSFSLGSTGEYQSQLTYWRARVIDEQRRIDALRGRPLSGHIPVRFVNGLPLGA